WHRVLQLKIPTDFNGHCAVDVTVRFKLRGRLKEISNDNYVSTSHAPFDVFVAPNPLPKTDGWCFGDFHCHTSFTCDQVEFGAPAEAAVILAKSMGLSFFCATDHSYDLDDPPNDYLRKDPELTKWKSMLREVHRLNRADADFVIIPGEEVSAGNSQGRNVHFLILNHPEFLPGDGDSAEQWFKTRPNLTIDEILNQLNSEAVAFAAHPAMRPPLLQRLLVRRGKWEMKDCAHPKLHGLQMWNGTDTDLETGKSFWIQLLLAQERKFIAAGNDAHGNFNRFRQIGIPFITMREHHDHLFGKVRTGVCTENGFGLVNCLEAFKKGAMVVTSGPFVDIEVLTATGKRTRIGQTLADAACKIQCECRASPEFGELKELMVYFGDFAEKREVLLLKVASFTDPYSFSDLMPLTGARGAGYVRAELYSEKSRRTFICLTNPIWIQSMKPV
ncbi:CehA/McbA family metallohydrolase, partial [bacterium]|nr:CehA/McbA family metallohydrolase [bacterium]